MSEILVRTNIQDFRRDLRDLGSRITRRVVRNATIGAARELVKQVKPRAPVLKRADPRRKAGALRDSLYAKKPVASSGAVTVTVSVRGKPFTRGKKSFAGAFYWRFLEGGWYPRGPGKRLRGGRRSRDLQRSRNAQGGAGKRAFPFLAPGLKASQASVLRVFEDRVSAGILREQARAR